MSPPSAKHTKGSLDFAEKFQDYHPSQRDAMIELETFLAYEKPLRNLHLQESRLWRRYEKEVAELRQLQQERQQNEELSSSQPHAQPNQKQEADRRSLAPEDSLPIGFEFSSTDLEQHLHNPRLAQSPEKAPQQTMAA